MENWVCNGKIWNVVALWLLNIDQNIVVGKLGVNGFGHVVLLVWSIEFFGVKNGFIICLFVVLYKIVFVFGF